MQCHRELSVMLVDALVLSTRKLAIRKIFFVTNIVFSVRYKKWNRNIVMAITILWIALSAAKKDYKKSFVFKMCWKNAEKIKL